MLHVLLAVTGHRVPNLGMAATNYYEVFLDAFLAFAGSAGLAGAGYAGKNWLNKRKIAAKDHAMLEALGGFRGEGVKPDLPITEKLDVVARQLQAVVNEVTPAANGTTSLRSIALDARKQADVATASLVETNKLLEGIGLLLEHHFEEDSRRFAIVFEKLGAPAEGAK